MASHDDFQLEYCSDEEIPEPVEAFSSTDLPVLTNPSPFHSEEASSESNTPLRRIVYLDLRHQTRRLRLQHHWEHRSPSTACPHKSARKNSATPSKPKRKTYVRKPKYNIRKGNTLFVKHTHIGKEQFKVSRPSSYIYKDVRFQKERKTYDVKLSPDGNDYEKEPRPACGKQNKKPAHTRAGVHSIVLPE